MTDGEVILPGKFNYPVEEIELRYGAGGTIGVVYPEEFGLLDYIRRDSLQVGKKIVLPRKRHIVWFPIGQDGAHCVGRVARVRHQGNVAGVDKAQGSMDNALFSADKRQYLFVSVKGDAKAFFVPSSYCPA